MAFVRLDVRGLKCPIPVLEAKKQIDAMAAGDLLEITATDPGSVADFQGWTRTNARAVLKEQRQDKDETGRILYIHVIERAHG